MNIFDLTHTLTTKTMPYPGKENSTLEIVDTVEKDGWQETLIRTYSHTGTHMDAPAHMVSGGTRLDEMPSEKFVGRAYVMDCTGYGENAVIPAEDIPDLSGIDFLILSTGWEEKWGKEDFLWKYPVLSIGAAQKIADAGLKGVGVDVMSVDPVGGACPVHMALFGADMVIIENLAGLIPIRGKTVNLTALPFKFENSDGAPVRVIAMTE